MATNSKNLYLLVNELRIDRGMSIFELCNGIISERTYLRYLKTDELEMKNQVFTQLLKRLDIDFFQFMTYYTHYYREDSGIYRFLGRVRFGHYFDITPIYHLILNYQSNNPLDDLLIKTYINVYEFESGQITGNEFKTRFLNIVEALTRHDNDHLYTKHILLLYMSFYPDEPQLDLEILLNDLLSNQSYAFMFVKIMHYYTLVLYALNYQPYGAENFKLLLDSFEFHCQFTAQKNNYTLLSLGRAYAAYFAEDMVNFREHLWQSGLNAIVIMDLHQLKEYTALVEKLFSLDIVLFMQEYATSGLKALTLREAATR